MKNTIILLLLPTLAFSQLNLQVVAHVPNDTLVSLAGCWHHVDSSGREYALVGTSRGLDIYDLSNPTDPQRIHQVPGVASNWREVCTWANHAYVGSEGAGSGITIVDLRQLPDSIRYHVWTGNDSLTNKIQRSHTLKAEDGYLYIFGSTAPNRGAIICSLEDPWEPDFVGQYKENYLHDGFIQGDTLWGSEIYAGQFSVIDISDKTQPVVLVTQPTPALFNHNTGLSDNSRVIFTTDEVGGAPLGAFDVSELDNITQLDLYKPSQRPNSTIHNVRVVEGDYLVCPSYGGQLTIVDASDPDNMIETAWALLGNSLVWDADPYLPSGIIFATAKAEGFFVFEPTYQRAAKVRGLVTDTVTGQPIINAKALIINTLNGDSTRLDGRYATGTPQAGTYDIRFERNGYFPKTITGVALQTGQTTLLDVQLKRDSSVHTVEPTLGLAGPQVWPTIATDHVYVSWPAVEQGMDVEITPSQPPPDQMSGQAPTGEVWIALYNPIGALVSRTTYQRGAPNRIELPATLSAGIYQICIESNQYRSAPVDVFIKK
jgi:choice-of-anchor B domain-containing protein